MRQNDNKFISGFVTRQLPNTQMHVDCGRDEGRDACEHLPLNSGCTRALKMRPAMLKRATAAPQSVEWEMSRKWEIEEGSDRPSGEFSAKEGNRRRRHPVSHCHGHELSFSQDRAAQSALVPDHQTESDE